MSCQELCEECSSLLSEAYRQMQSRVAKRRKLEDDSQPVQITEEVLRKEFCQAFGELQKKENFPRGRLAGCRTMHLADLFWARSACLQDANSLRSLVQWITDKVVPQMLKKYRSPFAYEAGDELPTFLLGPPKVSNKNPKGAEPATNPEDAEPVRLRQYLGKAPLTGWLGTVFRNRMRDKRRKRKRQVLSELLHENGKKNEELFENLMSKAPALRERLRLSVIQFLAGRTLPQKKAFKLRVVEGLTNDDCAAKLDCEPGNVSDRLNGCLDALCVDTRFRNSLIAIENELKLPENFFTHFLLPCSGTENLDEEQQKKQQKEQRKQLEKDLGKLFNWMTDKETRDHRLRHDVHWAFAQAVCRRSAEQKMVLKLRILDNMSSETAASYMQSTTERVVRLFDRALLGVCGDRQFSGELQWLEMEFDLDEDALRAGMEDASTAWLNRIFGWIDDSRGMIEEIEN